MGTIGTATSQAGAASRASDLATALLSNSPDTTGPAGSGTSATADPSSGGSRDPATRVDLSDKVKAILARASAYQDAADRLKELVDSLRSGAQDSAGQRPAWSGHHGSSLDVEQAFEKLSGGARAGDDPNAYQPVQVVKSFATGLKSDGYTISALASDRDGSSRIAIFGPNGESFLDQRFGTTGEFSGFSHLGSNVTAQEYQRGNKEYITFSQSESAATVVTAASDAGTVSALSSGTHTSSVTFVVDFKTGAITMAQSESLSVATNVRIDQPGSAFSSLA